MTIEPIWTPFAPFASCATREGCDGAVCIGIASDEAPPELPGETDAVLAGPGELLEMLTALGAAESPDGGRASN